MTISINDQPDYAGEEVQGMGQAASRGTLKPQGLEGVRGRGADRLEDDAEKHLGATMARQWPDAEKYRKRHYPMFEDALPCTSSDPVGSPYRFAAS